MTTYTRPLGGGTPTTGQVVKAVHVNDPIDQIYDTILAGGITADQIAAGAVDTSELATAAVTAVKMDGTLPDGSEMATSTAPTTDKQLANKKYIDDIIGSAQSGTNESNGEITFPNGLQFKWGHKSVNTDTNITLTFASESDVTAFSNACFSGWVVGDGTEFDAQGQHCGEFTATTMRITN